LRVQVSVTMTAGTRNLSVESLIATRAVIVAPGDRLAPKIRGESSQKGPGKKTGAAPKHPFSCDPEKIACIIKGCSII
jgi:hypothetical protein